MLTVSPAVVVNSEQGIEPLTVSLATAARLLGVSDRHVRSHLHEIPHIRIGGRLLFRVAALRHWLIDSERTGAGTSQQVTSANGSDNIRRANS